MSSKSVEVGSAVLDALRANVQGAIRLPGDPGYDEARRVWNAAVDRHPSAIITCADIEDVSLAVKIAADHGLPLTVRGGGHNVAGRSLQEGRLLLDLSQLRGVTVNPKSRIATVQGGALWSDVDAATAASGLATTGGLISSTGVGGFTLGGGAGWLMRKFGLACDNLRSAGVVLADGRYVRASLDDHPELFWGLRGGGGGLGVVTSFDLQLYALHDVVAGLVVHPADAAPAVLRAFRDYAATAPDEFCGLAVITHAPPLPFLDPSWHGRPVVILALCWCGDPDAGEAALAVLRSVGQPLAQHVGRMPYVQWQQMQDPGAPPGRYQYWKSLNFTTLEDDTLDQVAALASNLPTPVTEIHVQHLGGAVARVAPDETAFVHRHAQFFVNLIGVAARQDQFSPMRAWIRATHARLQPAALPGIMTNFSDQDDRDERRLFSHLAGRLAALRSRVDPAGILGDGLS